VAEISPGSTISHYRIISKIGAGGMGQVYQAQDIELGRPVALKFLSDELASHQNRVNRFIQEAKAASALNHPNILTVYEIGRAEDTIFIATEFVEGVTLRQHLRLHHPLKVVEALDIAIQTASALVAAHAAGIVHRDIKPENIMVRSDGIIKLLDFGLAKLTEREELSAEPDATTLALVNTEPGSILGTVAYMSPEQAAGRVVDTRADIWSVGVVLYEMLTAHTPFHGASKSHIIVAITDHEPQPLTQFAADVPEPLEWIISEALTKDPEERTQTAKEMVGKLRRLKQRIESGTLPTSPSDLSRSLPPQSGITAPLSSVQLKSATLNENARSTVPSGDLRRTEADTSAPVVRKSNIRYPIAIVLALIVLSAASFGLYKLLTQPKVLGPAKLSALTTGGKISGEDINGQVTISPDGKYVVFGANDTRQQASLWIRQVSTNSLVRLVPPQNGGFVGTTFSPDGEQIYYVTLFAKNNFVPALFRIPVLGGSPTKVLDRVFSPIGFSMDGKQFAFVRKNQDNMELIVANTDGSGQPRTIATQKQPNGFSTSGPSWSPDAKRIACGMTNGDISTVVEIPVEGGEAKPIGSEKWANVGRVLWLADGTGLIVTAHPEFSSIGTQVWFVPYPSGPARRITNDLNGYGDISLGLTSDSKTIATIQQINVSAIWVTGPNEDESRAQQILKTSLPEKVAWTPDGKLVYASRTGESWDIWISDRDGSQSKQLTADAFIDQQPTVSVDGRYIVFQSNRSGARNLWRMDVDGTNLKQLTDGKYVDESPVCSSDGRFVIFTSDRSGNPTIWKVGIDGGPPAQVTNHPSQFPMVSPDDKFIAYFYVDERSNNQPKVAILPFEGGEVMKSIDLPTSVQPIEFAWMPDGHSIAYADNASGFFNVWSQPIDGGAAKQLTNFKSEFVSSFAIAHDGKIAVYRWSATRDIVLIKDFR
jgi:serine/threonine protein kinase